MTEFSAGDKVRTTAVPHGVKSADAPIGSVGTVLRVDPMSGNAFVRSKTFSSMSYSPYAWWLEPEMLELVKPKRRKKLDLNALPVGSVVRFDYDEETYVVVKLYDTYLADQYNWFRPGDRTCVGQNTFKSMRRGRLLVEAPDA